MAEEKKGLIEEFKEFISRGNVMDMAVGVIIGGAFTGIVTSLTDDVINPLITLITGGNGTEIGGLNFNGVDVGKFLSAVINFLIVAACVFAIVKSVNAFQNATAKAAALAAAKVMKKEEEEAAAAEAAAPTCPHCLEEVKEGATRCPHCAGEIPGGAHAA
jgi:large conductance mechanosensitive channel